MRGIKNLAWISIATMLLLTMSGIVMASPPPWSGGGTIVFMDDWLNSAQPGDTFDVCIKAQDVTNLFVADVRVRFDFDVLEIVDDPATPDIEGITACDGNPSLEEIFFERISITLDPSGLWSEITVASGRPVLVKDGLNGTVGLTKLNLRVKTATDRSILKIFSSRMLDVTGSDIAHNVNHGTVENVYPTLTISNFVKPGWRRATLVPGLTNTLEATVSNTGDETANVRVAFKVTDPLGGIQTVLSNEVPIAAGDSETVYATYTLPGLPGVYKVQGTVEYEWIQYRWISWEDVEAQFGGEGTSKDVPGKGVSVFKAT